MADTTRESDAILADARRSLAENRAGGYHRRASIGRGSAALKTRHLVGKIKRIVLAVGAIVAAAMVAGLIVDGIGFAGIMITFLAIVVAVGVFAAFPRIKIPPLSQRPGDPVLLAKAFLKRMAAEMNPAIKGFAPDALAAIDAWNWPGNVRELENRVKRAVIMADGKLVGAADLDLEDALEEEALPLNIKSARERADRRVIRQALSRSEGNISKAAKLLGISRPTLYDLLKQYDLQG